MKGLHEYYITRNQKYDFIKKKHTVHIYWSYHAIYKQWSRSQRISVLTACTFMFRCACTIAPSFFKVTSGMHRRPFEGRHLVNLYEYLRISFNVTLLFLLTAPFHNTQLFSLLQCLSLTVSDKDRTAVQELSKPLTVLLHHLPYHLHLLHLIVMHVQRG